MDEGSGPSPTKGQLSTSPSHGRDDVAAAGVRVADAQGLDAVAAVRRVRRAGPGRRHDLVVPLPAQKDDLLDLMTDAVLGEVGPPPPRTGDWRADLAARWPARCEPRCRGTRRSPPCPRCGPRSVRTACGGSSSPWPAWTASASAQDDMLMATGTVTTFMLGSVVTELAERGSTSSLAHEDGHAGRLQRRDQLRATSTRGLAQVMREASSPTWPTRPKRPSPKASTVSSTAWPRACPASGRGRGARRGRGPRSAGGGS